MILLQGKEIPNAANWGSEILMIQKARPIRNALFFHYYCCFVEWQEEECSSEAEHPTDLIDEK